MIQHFKLFCIVKCGTFCVNINNDDGIFRWAMIFSCLNLAVPVDIMQHVVRVESSGNPYAIGVVGGELRRQPRNLSEAVATAKMLEEKGYNFSLGISQVNRYNLSKYGLKSYEQAFQVCPNLQAGSRILKECFDRSRDWGKSFSCYYSGNFVTGFRHGYVQKIFASMKKGSYSVPYIYADNGRKAEMAVQQEDVVRQKGMPNDKKNTLTARRVVDIPAATDNQTVLQVITSGQNTDSSRKVAIRADSGQNNAVSTGGAEVAEQKRPPVPPNTDSAFVF